MKRVSMFVAAVTLAITGWSGAALAFHGGGVGHCDGCHSMHATTLENGASANDKLLVGSDASSACLSCHAGSGSYHIMSTGGEVYSPGGDFYWINAGSWSVAHASDSTDFTRGHNVVADDYGLAADPVGSAPGGTYDANLLGCTSCHDAHGQVNDGTSNGTGAIAASGSYNQTAPAGGILGNFRLLGDSAYEAGDHNLDGFPFSKAVPVALQAINYGAGAEGWWAETDTKHTDYGRNMSEWCSNCHPSFLTNGNIMHPAGNYYALNGIGYRYNKYIASGKYTGAKETAFDALVPIERGTDNRELLDPFSTFGADLKSRVMCLSCHRAHAGGFDSMTRWSQSDEIIAQSGISFVGDDLTDAYYGRDIATDYDPYQRSLCNKCHVRD